MWWMWVVGGIVVIGLLLYERHRRVLYHNRQVDEIQLEQHVDTLRNIKRVIPHRESDD